MNESLFFFLNDFAGQSRFFDFVFIFSARYLIYIIVIAALFFIFKAQEKRRRLFIVVFGGAALAFVISQALNSLYPVARPFLALPGVNLLFEHGDYDSFPSGHATVAFAIATAVFFYNKDLGRILALGALLVGLSRVVVGVHWPLDILGGLILGGAVAAVLRAWRGGRYS